MADHVEVIGTGGAAAVPDLVVLDVRVGAAEPDVASALEAATTRVDAALAAAAALGVDEHDRRTTGMGVNQRWDHEARQVVGYTAHQTLRLRVRDRARVGDLVAALAEAAGDGFGLDGVTLEVTDPEPLLERAREAAFADAHHRAAQYARLAGRRLGAVTEVTETVALGAPLPRPKLFARDAAAAMPVEPGESTTTASVVVRFALEDA